MNIKKATYIIIAIISVTIIGIWYLVANHEPDSEIFVSGNLNDSDVLAKNNEIETVVEPEPVEDETKQIENKEVTDSISTMAPTEMPEPKEIQVHIIGAVKNPGVYTLLEGERVNDVVNAAGGLTEDAAQENINLAAYVKDAQQIIIYRVGEEPGQTEEPTESMNNPNESDESESESESEISHSADEEQPETTQEWIINGKININIASLTQLTTLPGIGDKIAEYIIEYRELNGKFTSIEQLKNIQRIGDKVFEGLKDMVTVGE